MREQDRDRTEIEPVKRERRETMEAPPTAIVSSRDYCHTVSHESPDTSEQTPSLSPSGFSCSVVPCMHTIRGYRYGVQGSGYVVVHVFTSEPLL